MTSIHDCDLVDVARILAILSLAHTTPSVSPTGVSASTFCAKLRLVMSVWSSSSNCALRLKSASKGVASGGASFASARNHGRFT